MSRARPLVIAHRGASSERPENTLAAYERAIEVGADGVECDVRLTRDGQLVCVHDRTIERTSDGRGPVSAKRLADLQRYDFGSWFGGEPASVLTVESLLGLLHDADRPVRLLIETKHPTRYGGLVEKKLVELLRRFGWTDAPPGRLKRHDHPVAVMSFAESALRRVHRLAPSLPTVLLRGANPGVRHIGLLAAPIAIAGPAFALLREDPGYVERAHTLGNQVYVWTVDELADVELVRDLGVDAVITNRPAEVLATLTRTLGPATELS
jgi:glycerophosphoryl diester phosphodiesterase